MAQEGLARNKAGPICQVRGQSSKFISGSTVRTLLKEQGCKMTPGPKPQTCSSPFRGVSWHKKSGKWRAVVLVDHTPRHLGFPHAAERFCINAVSNLKAIVTHEQLKVGQCDRGRVIWRPQIVDTIHETCLAEAEMILANVMP